MEKLNGIPKIFKHITDNIPEKEVYEIIKYGITRDEWIEIKNNTLSMDDRIEKYREIWKRKNKKS